MTIRIGLDPSKDRQTGKIRVIATSAVSSVGPLYAGGERRFPFGFQGGVHQHVSPSDLNAGLTLTVGAAEADALFPAGYSSIPRHVPDEWIRELRSIGSGEQLGEDDGFDEQE